MAPYVILPFGVPGVGKSTVLNLLVGDENFKTFAAKKSPQGVTRQIQIVSDKKFLGEGDPLISVVDVPGIGDPTLDIETILHEVEQDLSTKKVDILLLVLKATDDRVTLGEVMVMNMFRLVKRVDPQNIVVIYTRCDQEDVDDEFIKERLANLSKFAVKAGVVLNPQNLVKFNKTKESLRGLKKFLKHTGMEFEEDLGNKMSEVTAGLPDCIRNGASKEEVAGLMEQLRDMMEHLEVMKAEHREEIETLHADMVRREEEQAIEREEMQREREERHQKEMAQIHKMMKQGIQAERELAQERLRAEKAERELSEQKLKNKSQRKKK